MMVIHTSPEKVSQLHHFALLSTVIFVGLSTIHCKAQSPDLNLEERRAAIEKMYSGYHEGFPDVPEVEPAALSESLRDHSIVLVDVREPREWAISRIPGAITQAEFERNKETYRNRPIVAYCTIGYRSGQYARRLAAEGFTASNLRGSILAWVHAGEPVVDDDVETKRVHVYGPQWDLLPDGYESVW